MKFTVTQANLAKGLQIVNRVATTRSTLPVLGHILIAADGQRLRLVTTDLELAIETEVEAKVEATGAVTVPARTLTDFTTNTTDETIEFRLTDTLLRAKSRHVDAELKGTDASEFPTVPAIDPKSGVKDIAIAAPAVKTAVNQTVFATATDDSRPVLGGVALFIAGREATFVATDSYRLAEKKVTLATLVKSDVVAIVPAKTVAEVGRLLGDGLAQVVLSLDAHQIVVECGQTKVTSRLIDGAFPAYQGIIPAKLATSATLSRLEFIAALKMASLFSRDLAYSTTLTVTDKQIRCAAVSPILGASTSTVAAAITGPDVTTTFNARFILDALHVISGEAVQLRLSPPEGERWLPGILTGAESDYQYVIMPLRTP